MSRGPVTSREQPAVSPKGLVALIIVTAGVSAALPIVVPFTANLYEIVPSERWRGWALVLAPALALGGLLILLGARMAAKARASDHGEEPAKTSFASPGKVLAQAPYKTITADRPSTRFADVAGVEEAKEELHEVVDFLRSPERFHALGARVPRGVLLVGPPGTGKTLLSRAVAGEAGVPFISASGSQFVELYVGVGASRARSMFQEARKLAPCIVFIDEIDAVGRRRGGSVGVTHEEREQTLNQILVEMDGFDARATVIVLAATNRADVLDPALLRPGRFDRQVALDLPDAVGRLQILNVHAQGKPMAEAVDLHHLARQTTGLSGADLENLINEAAILAARRQQQQITVGDLDEALDRVVAGPRRKSRLLTMAEREITAYHEVGHALVAAALPNADKVMKISIVSRGAAGGYTRLAPEQDRNMWRESDFEAAMACAMGGHAAEALIFGEVTTGPSNDLQRVSEMARRMVTSFGMSKRLGPLTISGASYGYESDVYRSVGDETARQVDQEVHRVVSQALRAARAILEANRAILERGAQALLERESLEADEIEALFRDVRFATAVVGPRRRSVGRSARARRFHRRASSVA